MNGLKSHLFAVPALLLGLTTLPAPEAKAQGIAFNTPTLSVAFHSGGGGHDHCAPRYGRGFGYNDPFYPRVPGFGPGWGSPGWGGPGWGGFGPGYGPGFGPGWGPTRFVPAPLPVFVDCHRCGHRHYRGGPCGRMPW